jgi:quercetin dioxygenase-like cupin family protein
MESIGEFPEFIRKMPRVALPFDGARGWLMQGEKHQAVFVEFDDETEVPEHSHAEQWEFPLAGSVRVHMGGGSVAYRPGEHFYIPAGVPHRATVSGGYRAMMLFNSPDRYKPME